MNQYAEYLLLSAVIMMALALGCNIGFVTAKGKAMRKIERSKISVGKSTKGSSAVREDASTSDLPSNDTAADTRVRGLGWYGTAFVLVAFGLLTLYLGMRTWYTGHAPFANQHEYAVSFSWAILAVYLVFFWFYRIRTLSLAVFPVVMVLVLYAMRLDSGIEPLVPALQNRLLLTLHVVFAIFSYGAACISFAAAVLYLLRPKLKMQHLPSLQTLDDIGYRAAVICFPLLTMMIILGAVWADIAWGRYWGWDPKETSAFVTWLIYGAYLHARVVQGWQGKRSAWLLVLGFAAVLFTYFSNHIFGGLHSYG